MLKTSDIKLVMGFDFGTKKIGIAIGQKLTGTAQPIAVLKSKLNSPDWRKIEDIYNQWKPTILIVGLPLQINGNSQPITNLAKEFSIQLKKRFCIIVKMYDERFSTVEARIDYLKYYYNDIKKTQKNYLIDAISAAIILQGWFNQLTNNI